MSQSNNKNQPGRSAENTDPMKNKEDVGQSVDNKTDQDFPGYPHYPAKEDIMDQRTDSHRVDLDVENLPNSRNLTGVGQRFAGNQTSDRGKNRKDSESSSQDPEIGPRTETGKDNLETLDTNADEIGTRQNVDNDDLGMNQGTDADVSDDERRTLEDASYMPTQDADNLRTARLDNTDFDGEALNEESFGDRKSGSGLDIPDETDETFTDALGQGDEENKYFSLGGDRQEGNEEDPYSNPARDVQ
jgi:hypothetical protein